MADFIYEPILDTDGENPTSVLRTANRLLDPGVYKHLTEFPALPYAVDDFSKEVATLTNLDANSKGNTKILLQCGEQCEKVYGMIKETFVYVYPLCLDNLDMIILSGFSSNSPATKHQVIGPVNIKSITAGNEAGTVKILIEQLEGDQKTLNASKTYLVYVYDDLTGDAVRLGCASSSSRMLIVENVTVMKKQYYAIIVQNSAGCGPSSDRREFTLTK